MVNKPLIRPYFFGGVALGGAARIPLIYFLPLSTMFDSSALEDYKDVEQKSQPI